MDLTPYIESLRRDLLQAAALGDENTQRTAAALAGAVEPSARLALMNALSDLAAEITGSLDDTTVEVKLDGKDVRIAIEHHERFGADDDEADYDPRRFRKDAGHADPEDIRQAMRDAGTELSRTTVRLFNDLKSQAELAANDQGISLNSYISKAVADSVRGVKGAKSGKSTRRGGRNVSGWIQG